MKDSLTIASGGEGAHFADASAHFDKEPVDNVGGADALPMRFGAPTSRQHAIFTTNSP